MILVAAAMWMVAQQPVTETITVTAARTERRVADTPASVVVLSRAALENAAAPTLDEALRQVAGFTLFRRSGSRTANPTAQGVTLRGLGASGASRALVLDDGVPLNDPFGGWVYWGRVPRVALRRAELLRGGASDLYGSSAMGGVVQFVRRRDVALEAELSAGAQETGGGSLFAGFERGVWSGNVAAELFTTGGYIPVRASRRGAADIEAGSRHSTVDVTARRGDAFVRLSHFMEDRQNGTPLQVNDTEIRQLAAGREIPLAGGALSLRAHAADQDYHQTFSAVAADRQSERLTVEQRVPSRGAGGSAQYTRALGSRHAVIAGAETRHVRGVSEERRFTPAGIFDGEAGGRQQSVGAYLETLLALTPAWSATAGVRGDWWRNEGAEAKRGEAQWNPRLAVLWRAREGVAVSASAYRAFRAPTLNELYRGFRVGNVNTLPNDALQAESMTGLELGVRLRNIRLTLFDMTVGDTIANVTVSQTPELITRQRRNLGSTRSRGVEVDGEWTIASHWRLSAGVLSVDASVREGELRGRRIPQVPRHQATAQLAWKGAALQLRWSGPQFDDDRNELPLRSFTVADFFLSRAAGRGLEATVAVENLLDEEIEVSATPVVTLGQPRSWRVGLRYRR